MLKKQFQNSEIPSTATELTVGSFPEWDSLGQYNLLLLIEQRYGVRFSMREMSEMKSLKDIFNILVEKGIKD